MADAAYNPAYSSAGYEHFSGGGCLVPADFHGLCALLVRHETETQHNSERKRRALAYLLRENQLVARTLTCYERRQHGTDAFPDGAGHGGQPILTRPVPQHEAAPNVRTLNQRTDIAGALLTVQEPNADVTLLANAVENVTVGARMTRIGGIHLQHAVPTSEETSIACALHPTLYPTGKGGWYKKVNGTSCDEMHYNKARLGSVCPKYRLIPEVH